MSQSAIEYLEEEKNRKLAKAKAITDRASQEGRSLASEERDQLQATVEEVKNINERIETRKANEEMSASIERLRESAKAPEKVEMKARTIGEAFTKSEGYGALLASGLSGKWSTGPVELPGVHAATVTETASPIVQPDTSSVILPTLFKRLTIADLIMPGTTTSNTVRYLRENPAPTNAAAAIAEGDLKPESTILFDSVDEPVRKIATFLPVSDEMLEDVDQIRSYLDGRLRLFVQQAEEAQLYSGSGTAPNLRGLVNRTGIQTQARGTDTAPDAVYKAMNKVRINAFMEPDGIVIHPSNWEVVRLAKDGQGQYYGGGPFMGPYGNNGIAGDVMWGLPVVVTPAATAGTALVGAFRTAAQIFRRSGLTVEASNSHSDFFQKNLTAIRAEERLALAVYRPAAFCTVTGLL